MFIQYLATRELHGLQLDLAFAGCVAIQILVAGMHSFVASLSFSRLSYLEKPIVNAASLIEVKISASCHRGIVITWDEMEIKIVKTLLKPDLTKNCKISSY